ncbi:MAG: hypothetical protein IPM82_22650 [Saprospiraceae bacterium]|nr:hypothetical protein [Saprospiraceae bacterium]
MNKKVIWLIIGLMSAALIGIAAMQAKWVVDSLQANEEQFNNQVVAALNKVADKLEEEEEMEAYRHVDNGFAQDFYQSEVRQQIEMGGLTFSIEDEDGSGGHTHLTKQQLIEITLAATNCTCSECQADRAKKLSQFVSITQGLDLAPITERIELDMLSSFLRQEFQDKGIKIPFRYGVFDNRKKSFVIADGRYTVEDSRSQPTLEGYKNLNNSEYRVGLFQRDKETPGLLMVFFPTKSSFLWSSVLKNLIGSIIFTGIILFCFFYTISVIFKQKKVSEMKNDFINNMTHEFKTPIATISLASDSISSPMVINSPDKIRRFTDIIRQENKRMNNQVEKVLQMAQIDRQDFDIKTQRCKYPRRHHPWRRLHRPPSGKTGRQGVHEPPCHTAYCAGRHDAYLQHNQQLIGQCEQIFARKPRNFGCYTQCDRRCRSYSQRQGHRHEQGGDEAYLRKILPGAYRQPPRREGLRPRSQLREGDDGCPQGPGGGEERTGEGE